ncbi:MAG TPA: hypothetical protein VMU54_14590 [Planctomycetota bacterium]|nr:hypothetical protein [Planctomycetota bacterium]
MTIQAIEFLDPDGSYALVQPFDEVRGRVLSSNVLEKGSVLHKDAELAWGEAAEDLGGFTRLSPSDFLQDGVASAEPSWDSEDLCRLLEDPLGDEDEERSRDPLLDLESPPPGPAIPDQEADPVGFLLRLVRHLWNRHLKKDGGSCWVTLCRCPAFQVKGERLRTRLQELITAALEKGRLPRLSRVLVSLRDRLGRRSDAA